MEGVGLRARGGVRRRTHLPEPDLRSYQISFNWTECHLQNGGALAGRLAEGRRQPPPSASVPLLKKT